MGRLMHAVQYYGYGGGAAALKHVDVPIPIPKKDEILIKLEAASINPFDWKVQKGKLWPLFPRKFPCIPGGDVAGEVIEVGQGVKKFKLGDKVVGLIRPFSDGGLAEFAVVKESLTASRPTEISASDCAGLPIAGMTALQALSQSIGIKLDGSGERKNILITAASGGVGHYAVQLAKLGNTHVTATCGARNIELIKSLGAVDIPWSTFEPNLSENGKVIDVTPNFSSMLIVAQKKLTFSKKQLVPLLLFPKGEYLVDLVKQGKLRTVIDSKYPITKAEDGWAKSIDGHATGKIIFEF